MIRVIDQRVLGEHLIEVGALIAAVEGDDLSPVSALKFRPANELDAHLRIGNGDQVRALFRRPFAC